MPLRFAAHPPAVLLLAALVALQALLSARASAQAVPALTPGLGELAIICHGYGTADPANGMPPEPDKSQHPCCLACAAAAAAVVRGPWVVLRQERGRASQPMARVAVAIAIAPRAVRVGFSHAPPHRL